MAYCRATRLRGMPRLYRARPLAVGDGHWSGSFSITAPDGINQDGTAFMILKQEGAKITFEVKSTEDGTVFKCDLVLDGDHLKGPISAVAPDGQRMAAKADLSRVK